MKQYQRAVLLTASKIVCFSRVLSVETRIEVSFFSSCYFMLPRDGYSKRHKPREETRKPHNQVSLACF